MKTKLDNTGLWRDWNSFWNNKRGFGQQDPVYNLYLNRITEFFDGLEGKRFLEIGSGRGQLSYVLMRHGAVCTAVDRSLNACRVLKRGFQKHGMEPPDTYCQDLFNPIPGEPFDGCVSVGTVEHFEDYQRLYARLDGLAPKNWHVVCFGEGKVKRYPVEPEPHMHCEWWDEDYPAEIWTWHSDPLSTQRS